MFLFNIHSYYFSSLSHASNPIPSLWLRARTQGESQNGGCLPWQEKTRKSSRTGKKYGKYGKYTCTWDSKISQILLYHYDNLWVNTQILGATDVLLILVLNMHFLGHPVLTKWSSICLRSWYIYICIYTYVQHMYIYIYTCIICFF